ncbi:hypothetical protein EVAR_20937_1 [Eumeta japonica]|uniref:Uncharacterized protein n=1 Tax=Eumeta variegata TaxID=151549 RepID=A0A4C1UXJ5_EUMVA|nr:hypothetical protein EVAR_20937_1 [Eumeta japonica]
MAVSKTAALLTGCQRNMPDQLRLRCRAKLQRQRLQTQQNIVLIMIAGAVWYVKNDVIARDLRVETIEEFVTMLARRTFNRADAGPYPSLHNLAPHYDRPTKGYQLPRDLVSKSPNEGKL